MITASQPQSVSAPTTERMPIGPPGPTEPEPEREAWVVWLDGLTAARRRALHNLYKALAERDQAEAEAAEAEKKAAQNHNS